MLFKLEQKERRVFLPELEDGSQLLVLRVPVLVPLGAEGLAGVEHVQLLLSALQGELAAPQEPQDSPVVCAVEERVLDIRF